MSEPADRDTATPLRGPRGLVEVLAESRRRGFLGPASIESQLAHAKAFAEVVGTILDERVGSGPGVGGDPLVVDLGSGGGVPSCALIISGANCRIALVERSARRADFLEWMIHRLGAGERVWVVRAEAEDAARTPELQARAEVVTARSFGPPAVVAECGCRLLVAGGSLVVSEPPIPDRRWFHEELAELGLETGASIELGTARFQRLIRVGEPAERYPRRAGIPRKRPLW